MATRGDWCDSTVTQADIGLLVDEGIIPTEYVERIRIPQRETSPKPKPGEFIMFTAFLKRGLAFPTSVFFRTLLAFYGLQPHNLAPNSILQISCFVALCEFYLGCAPFFPLWLQLFRGKLQTTGRGGPPLRCGGVTFQIRDKNASQYPDIAFPKKVSWRMT